MTDKPNVLFVNLPTVPLKDVTAVFDGTKSLRSQSIAMPLGILYLSSSIKRAGHVNEVGILDYVLALEDLGKYEDLDSFIAGTARAGIGFVPDVLAFSLIFSASYGFFARCVYVLKQIWPRAVTIVGGVHATNTVKHLLGNPNVDYVARGECEISLVQFLDQLQEDRTVKVKGIYAKRDSFGEDFELGETPSDLDTLPFPDWELINMEKYVGSLGRQRDIGDASRHASLMTTRGCYFRCTFCSAHTVHGRKVRYRSVRNVLDEMERLHSRYGVTLFMPEDDLFTASKKRVLALLAEIKRLSIPGLELQFPAALSVNTLTETVIDALVEADMKILVLAVESGSSYVQKYVIKKNCDLKKVRFLAEYAKSKGLLVRCYFIFGFPTETLEQIRETIEYAKSLEVDWCVFNIATPLVGSEMYDQFVKAGCIEDGPETWASVVFDERWFNTPEVTAEDLNSVVYRANLECNFIHNPNIVRGEYQKAIHIFQDILRKHPFHIVAWYCIRACHKELGNVKESKRAEEKLWALMRSDKRAEDMFAKYKDLMPDLAARTM